jgi:signal transduction histidine kinase
MPMDLALAIVLFFSFMCAALVLEMWDIRASAAKTFCTFGVGLTLSYIAVLAFCMSFAVNVKVGGWWGRTVICRLWKLLGRFFRWLWKMLGITLRAFRETMAGVKMGKRVWALFVLFVFCEFVGLVIFRHEPSFLMFFWLIEKIIFFLALMKILLDFGKVKQAGAEIAGGNLEYKVETEKMLIDMADVGNSLNTIGNGITSAVEERMKSERMKTELITNVSHDIKTPLTSIINYTDLLTKLDLKDPKAQEYLEVLGRQSARLKKLIEDLIEASKASSGALKLDMEKVNASMLLMQALGEYEEKFRRKGLDLRVTGETSEMMVRADSRYLWRIFDNLMSNMLKYAQAGTRAYIDMTCDAGEISIIFRNISDTPLNITGDELMERFVRGDSSRSTEGSGLGLSIADSLVALMGGTMEIVVDGDLFKVIVRMPAAE